MSNVYLVAGVMPNVSLFQLYTRKDGKWVAFYPAVPSSLGPRDLYGYPLDRETIQYLRRKRGGVFLCTEKYGKYLDEVSLYARYKVGTVREISKDTYDWWFESLPAEKWDGASFLHPDPVVGNLYYYFTRHQKRYYLCVLPSNQDDFVAFMHGKIISGDFVKLEVA